MAFETFWLSLFLCKPGFVPLVHVGERLLEERILVAGNVHTEAEHPAEVAAHLLQQQLHLRRIDLCAGERSKLY